MGQPIPDADLVVATPERVSFSYQVAGLGTRAIAQILDLLIVAVVLVAVGFAAGAFAAIGANTVADLVGIVGSFVVIFGYFWASEALWSGQTVGKRVFRLRAVGDRGEPMTFTQAGIRNVVRIVDFLPYAYGVGLVVLFANGRGKRLGDIAAGTVVVKDSDSIALWQVPGAARPPAHPADGLLPPPPPPSPPSPAGFAPAPAAELALRRLDPDLRRFVSSYARRRSELPLELRAQLAGVVQKSVGAAVPEVFQQSGPLAALDHLADLERQRGA
ncbi:MAG TPA: RDD family protein [Candidatus Udaeobacter sp.]|nr:RDD family protein [Candidatus Udaeobacter sp.]